MRNSRRSLLALAAASSVIGVLAAGGAAAAAQGAVTSEGDSASLNTFQALNGVDTQNRDKFESDFLFFAESLIPPDLVGTEGRSKVFISQASSLVTSSAAFPLADLDGVAVSGRLLAEVLKTINPAPGVPVSSADGSLEVDFETSATIPFQFAGTLQTTNNDSSDCTRIVVTLSGPFNRTFVASHGGDCPLGEQRQRGWVVTDRLPAGSYELEVDYGGTVAAGDPGTLRSTAALEVSLAFQPPNTRLTRARINSRRRQATFRFRAVGQAKGFQCALSRGKRKARFRKCRSPKRYRKLKPGRYTFQVRVLGPVAPDATPAKKQFRIRKR